MTACDAIHDQAHPAAALRNIHRSLRADGTFLMVDIKASSKVESRDVESDPFNAYFIAGK